MLTREIMAWVALWVLWGNTLLIALAAGKQAWRLLSRARVFRQVGLADGAEIALRGVVAPGSRFESVVEQNGRVASGGEDIVWHDRSYASRIAGEIVLEGGERVHVDSAEREAEVWVTQSTVDRSSACKSAADFDHAYTNARRVKGFARTVVAAIEPSAPVVAYGVARKTEAGWSLEPASGRLVVAEEDPRRWARGRALVVFAGFIPGIFAGAAACTWLALSQPIFDSATSKLGGLCAFLFFLLVLPAGTTVRDWMREPHERIVRGKWEKKAVASESGLATN